MEPEPRKMQAERPPLLMDLSTSRLLSKYKAEIEGKKSSNETNETVAKVTENKNEPIENEVKKVDSDATIVNSPVKYEAKSDIKVYAGELATQSPASMSVSSNGTLTNLTKDESPIKCQKNSLKRLTSPKNQVKFDIKSPVESPRKHHENGIVVKQQEQHNEHEAADTIGNGVVSGMPKCIDGTPTHSNPTTPRKTVFNPLHVILKDKNKYYTTEYI